VLEALKEKVLANRDKLLPEEWIKLQIGTLEEFLKKTNKTPEEPDSMDENPLTEFYILSVKWLKDYQTYL
jgi:hypothetical protein